MHVPTLTEFLRWRDALQTHVRLEIALVDLCAGDHAAAMLLSVMLEERARIPAGAIRWVGLAGYFPMPWQRIWERTRVREHTQGQRALRTLARLGYARHRVFGVAHRRTCLHVSLDEERLMHAWAHLLAGEAPTFLLEGEEHGAEI